MSTESSRLFAVSRSSSPSVDVPGAWSDSDDDGIPASSNLTSAKLHIKALESKLKQAKRDLIDYKAFVSRRLDIGRLKDVLDEPTPTAAPSTRDNDSHYFDSYDDNGRGGLALNLHQMHESSRAHFIGRYTCAHDSR